MRLWLCLNQASIGYRPGVLAMEKCQKSLFVSDKLTPEIVEFLENNEIGQEGKGMVYKHLNVKPKVEHIAGDVEYLKMKLGGKIVGICANVKRKLEGEQTAGYYIRYFSFLKGLRVKRPGHNLNVRNSEVKKKIAEYLESYIKNVVYAYVDLTNMRSRAVCELFQFKEVGQFSTLIFSRIFPKASNRIHEVELSEVKSTLNAYYKEYSLFTTDNMTYKCSKYFVIKHKGELIAGLAATKERWQILSIPGFLGKLLMKVKLPLLSRLFNSDYRFLAVEGIFVKEGCERVLVELMEGVLKLTGHNVAMMWADVNSPLYTLLKSLPMGVLSRLKSEVKASVIAKNNIAHLKNIYISGFDLT